MVQLLHEPRWQRSNPSKPLAATCHMSDSLINKIDQTVLPAPCKDVPSSCGASFAKEPERGDGHQLMRPSMLIITGFSRGATTKESKKTPTTIMNPNTLRLMLL